jgi:hypothetical protein
MAWVKNLACAVLFVLKGLNSNSRAVHAALSVFLRCGKWVPVRVFRLFKLLQFETQCKKARTL